MDRDEVWRTIDQQRGDLADLFGTFTAADWETQSLCTDWRVRDVAAHLTLAQGPASSRCCAAASAAASSNRMIRDTAIRQAERARSRSTPSCCAGCRDLGEPRPSSATSSRCSTRSSTSRTCCGTARPAPADPRRRPRPPRPSGRGR